MLPINFQESNFIFNKPAEMTDEECCSLPVFKGNWPDGAPTIISVWQFSKEDLEEIQRTGRIYLSIAGHGMPPVSLFTENPFASEPAQK